MIHAYGLLTVTVAQCTISLTLLVWLGAFTRDIVSCQQRRRRLPKQAGSELKSHSASGLRFCFGGEGGGGAENGTGVSNLTEHGLAIDSALVASNKATEPTADGPWSNNDGDRQARMHQDCWFLVGKIRDQHVGNDQGVGVKAVSFFCFPG
jgi:hypothetical protein